MVANGGRSEASAILDLPALDRMGLGPQEFEAGTKKYGGIIAAPVADHDSDNTWGVITLDVTPQFAQEFAKLTEDDIHEIGELLVQVGISVQNAENREG